MKFAPGGGESNLREPIVSPVKNKLETFLLGNESVKRLDINDKDKVIGAGNLKVKVVKCPRCLVGQMGCRANRTGQGIRQN